MYGRPSLPFHHSGGGGRAPAPPRPQQQQPPYQPQYPLQNPNNLLYLQNPNLLLLNNLLHNINNVPIQPQNPNCHAQNMNFQPQNYHPSFPTPQPQLLPQSKTTPANFNVNEVLERLDRAVIKARRDILASGGNVSAWKVSQEALLALEADSWESLGFQMQQVPSLHRLMAIEAKINTFIHCYVGVRKVTTLYDLELAICKNEGVGLFDELELGPLVRHPLVIHYFSVSPDAKEVFRITSEDIISYLHEFLNTHRCKEVKVDELLDFIAEKRSNTSREKLNVRIQSLGLHISVIRKAVQSENTVLKKHVDGLKKKFGIRIRKRPILSSQKGELDDRFNELSQRMKSLSSVDKIFCGKHIRFASSSSDDDGSDNDDDADENGNYTDYEDNRHGKDVNRSDANFTSQNLKNSERVSSCPYPSASEEMTRLGLKPDADSSLADDTDDEENSTKDVLLTRKRKSTRDNESISLPTKLPKREDKTNFHTGDHKKKSCSKDTSDSSFVNDSTRMFLTTWKETCRNNSADEILDRMLHLHGTRKKKLLRALFSSYPFSGLLDVAVKSIKSGMWDSMYDTLQTFDQHGALNSIGEKPVDCISIEVESDEENAPISATKLSKNECGVTVNDIIEKISKYFDLDGDVLGYTNPTKKMRLSIWRKLYRCESWLVEQLSVKEFECLGFGDFVMFLERYWHQLPDALQKFLIGDECENLPFEACMLQVQLDVLLSQASNNIWQNEKMSKKLILGLLSRQFPSICFKSVKNDFLIDFEDMLRKNERNIAAKCVLFSATLLKENGVGCSSSLNEKILPDSAGSNLDIDPNAGSLGLVTTKDAIEVLLRAPMLTDLDIWAHWDIKYAPSLGSLVVWLLNEVNIRELLCLVTKGGKVIRLDHSATMESFLDVLLEGSSFGTAVKLLSLLALYGGEGNVPLSLLKCHAQKAFEVIIKSIVEKECHSDQGFLVQGESMPLHDVLERSTSWNLSDELYRDRSRVSKVLQVISRFMLDCLSYLPTEFCSFAATVLLAGLQTLVKDAPSAILSECKKVEQRIMLHDVGFSLGILEWIDDHHQFWSSTLTNSICTSESSCSRDASYDCNWGTGFLHNRLEDFLPSVSVMAAPIKSDQNDDHKEVNSIEQIAEVSVHLSPDNTADRLSKPDCIDDPMGVIDSIRRDEFGLDPSLSTSEGRMLMKQHARLGRALHCLSHELYSQDSHFLLELVQNADDNIYPQNVEPSLTFILQEKSIVVLNNEMGFSAENIRALCDVGNSTKREHSAGYIGKKGIGFKSVFRVTDAPEIHSNGFHIKFDVTEGQIGFVLPTVVPSCDTELYSRLLSTNADHVDYNSWRTCIVLPFKAALSQGFAMNKIVSMFSDLHPSLLLFLHRLQCIKLRNMLDNSLTVMRKEVAGDGIIKVSMGKEKMVWLVVSQKLQSNTIRHDANETEISIAFSLEETSNGEYIPQLHQQPAFAFLPLRTYGLKFIVQGDFVLPSSREEVDGDSPWNQWLLSEIPELFVSAQKSFCDLPCFRDNAAKAVTAFMSFVPFVGEVHGFFSSLPRLIMSKLRMSNCLLLEADKIEWVPPCKVLGKWNEQARVLLPNWLLHKHLGLGFLKKDIILSDSLARALGIEEYGPKTLFHAISSLSRSENGLKDRGLCWLSTWINEFYLTSLNSGTESDLIFNLRKIPFIPLSDGKYCSVDRGTIWLHCDSIGVGNEYDFKCFPKLYTKLQIVNPALFSAAVAADKSCLDASVIENVTRMLIKVGVQRLSAHEIVKVHILPSISDSRNFLEDKDLLTDYLSFILFHLQSSCPNCCTERDWIMAHLRNEAVVLTNYGYKKLNEVPIHFSKEFRNPIDMNKLVTGIDMKWHELDSIYLKHPITKSVPDGLLKWRNFFQELGITDFVQMVQIEKSTGNVGMTPMGPNVKDWESWELDHMLSQFSSRGDHEKCKYLLEILDTLWDDYFRDKVTGSCTVTTCEAGKSFNSSVISILQNAKWMVSVMDDDLHYPKDLFLDCEAVRSILGVTAPYAIPKVRNQMLLDALGLKSHVRIHDILSLLEVWRRRETPFKASIAQMSRLYTFIWSEMATSKSKIMEELSSGPFIFFPYVSGCSPEDIVTGVFLSPKEVYWHDTTGSMDQMKLMQPKCDPDMNKLPFVKMLSRVYPILHDFFVNECGVEELPPINGYLQFLVQLSATALPSEVARTVFNVFSKWADRLKCGSLNNKDAEYLRERFLEKECAVLPTAHDKWVSLHPSFGLICWSDDDKLRKEFKYLEGVEILCFGNLMDEEKDLLQTKVANLMSRLGIPALSAVVSREAIYYGPTDSSLKASLVNWALPYAQRYICHVHPDKYLQLKQTGFGNVKCLQIVVVEKLFYRNVVKRCEVVSKKRFECSCLLQDKILYATRESDSHTIFMELSRLLFDDAPELHLANFLHMITTMAEAGASEEQTEIFILNSQKVPKLPEGETIWSLSFLSGIVNDESCIKSSVSAKVDESDTFMYKKKSDINSNWPPVGWKTAPGFIFARANGLKTQAGHSVRIREAEDSKEITIQTGHVALANLNSDLSFQGGPCTSPAVHLQFQDGPSSTTPEECLQFQDGPIATTPEACVQFQDGPSSITQEVCLQNTETPEDQSDHASNITASGINTIFDSVDPVNAMEGPHFALSDFNLRNQLSWGNTSAQAALTGRVGEFVAFRYFAGRVGASSVKWVNEASETGLPYDLLIGNEEHGWEYIEVKATKSRSATRDLAFISVREWQFAFEKGESFSIAHVILLEDNTARVTTYKNPVKLCQLGKLRLAVIMPKQLELSNIY